MKLEHIVRIRIVYKSGHTEEFDCTEFKIERGTYTWVPVKTSLPQPLMIGADDIAAVWIVRRQKKLYWGK